MKKCILIATLLSAVIHLQAQNLASTTTLPNTDEVFMWIERAKELQKKLNQTTAEKEELERLVRKMVLEKKKAELNYTTADLKFQQLANACQESQDASIRIRDSLNDLIQIHLNEREKADKRIAELEGSLRQFRAVIDNQNELLEARATEFAAAQQSIGSFSHIQFNVRNLWVRLEDNPAHIFASNKQDQIKVVAYHITSSFETRKNEIPVRFRLIKKVGHGRNAKPVIVIDEKFLIPEISNLSDTAANDLSTPTSLQKFEGEYIIPVDDGKMSKLESGTYYYEILIDNTVEKRSYPFQLVNKVFGR